MYSMNEKRPLVHLRELLQNTPAGPDRDALEPEIAAALLGVRWASGGLSGPILVHEDGKTEKAPRILHSIDAVFGVAAKIDVVQTYLHDEVNYLITDEKTIEEFATVYTLALLGLVQNR